MSSTTASDQQPDPFDLDNLRLCQDFAKTTGVAKKLVTVPVRKPNRGEFVRVHRDPDYRIDTLILELKDQREAYLVGPGLRDELATEPTVSPRRLVTAVNRRGTVFLWPLKLPGADGRVDNWAESALETAELAADKWVRVESDMSLGAYQPYVAGGDLGNPVWPTESFQDLVKIAFRGRLIETWDHPVLKTLRGEQ